jgi:hypothetical protein
MIVFTLSKQFYMYRTARNSFITGFRVFFLNVGYDEEIPEYMDTKER